MNPLILLGYGVITVLTPRFNAYDSAAPKFLSLAVLNLVVYVFFLFRKEQRPPDRIFSSFFSNRTGLLYGLFLAVSLLSFFKAVNPAESLLAFTKLFTVFSAAMIIAAILRLFVDRKRLKSALLSLAIVALIPLFIYLGWILLSHYSPTVRDFNLKDRITARLGSIKTDVSSGTRIPSWGRSVKLVREDPLLGVGTGNWKVAVLKYENQVTPDLQC